MHDHASMAEKAACLICNPQQSGALTSNQKVHPLNCTCSNCLVWRSGLRGARRGRGPDPDAKPVQQFDDDDPGAFAGTSFGAEHVHRCTHWTGPGAQVANATAAGYACPWCEIEQLKIERDHWHSEATRLGLKAREALSGASPSADETVFEHVYLCKWCGRGFHESQERRDSHQEVCNMRRPLEESSAEKASPARQFCSANHNDPNCPICHPEKGNCKHEHGSFATDGRCVDCGVQMASPEC